MEAELGRPVGILMDLCGPKVVCRTRAWSSNTSRRQLRQTGVKCVRTPSRCCFQIRTTKLAAGVSPILLTPGQKLKLVSRADVLSSPDAVGTIYTGLAGDVKPGHRVLFSDGLMQVMGCKRGTCTVLVRYRHADLVCASVVGAITRFRPSAAIAGRGVNVVCGSCSCTCDCCVTAA